MNPTAQLQKLAVAAVLFAAWSYLVYIGKAPLADYIENIKIGLGGLGLYHVVTSGALAPASGSPAPAKPAEPTATPDAPPAPKVAP